ncbi:unannotated protein [freshwater metagenome]|uniref:Unannotated protein n=1 Tax=freshwater metagenome TaxID=449393 RepID=A0A6J6I353_9ZZZZ
MQMKPATLMRVGVQVIDALGIKGRCATNQSVDFVALAQQQLCEIRAVLTGDPGNQGNFRHDTSPSPDSSDPTA